jgi:hypothetical protein
MAQLVDNVVANGNNAVRGGTDDIQLGSQADDGDEDLVRHL